MTIAARLQIIPGTSRRGWKRRRLSLDSTIQATRANVVIHDLSSTGLLIETAADLAVLDDLEIRLPEVGFTPASVIWNSGRYFGCQFKETISQAAISAALLRSPPARQPEPGPSANEALEPVEFEDDRASFGVRLRVIFGSAILLWGLIIWAGLSLFDV